MKKGIERIIDHFGNRGSVLLMGLGSGIYLYYCFFAYNSEDPAVANILPPLHFLYYVGLIGCVLLFQIMVWKRFKLFSEGWHRNSLSYLFLLSEFLTLYFVFSLASWLAYFLYLFFTYQSRI